MTDGTGGRGLRRPLTRRQALRGAAVGAGAVAVAGMAAPGAASAAPTRGSGVIDLVYQSNWQGSSWNATAIKLCQHYIDGTFNVDPKYRGLRATVSPNNGQGQAASVIAAALASAPGVPDIIESCCTDITVYEGQNFLAPLNPYVSTANIDPMKLFVRGHVEALTLNGTLYALPSYDAPPQLYYRQDILDTLGLPYPNPNWTYEEAANLWRSCTDLRSKTPRSGVSLYGSGPELEWLYRGYGTTQMNSAHTRSLLNDSKVITAATWYYNMMIDKVAIPRDDPGAIYGNNPAAVFVMAGGWDLLPAIENLQGAKWNIIPMPAGPVGYSTTYDNIDFYGMLRTTKYPQAAWELLQWLACDPTYTRFMMRVNLTGPALVSMWSEWQTVILEAAPPLRDKAIHYYAESALNGHAYPSPYFVQGNTEAETILSNWQTKIIDHQVSVTEGYTESARQINAWLSQANTYFKQQNAEIAALRRTPVGPTDNYPAPPTKGIGAPYHASPYILVKNGTYTMLGDGWDIYDAEDSTTFACLASDATEGEWVCRVVGVANVSCPQPSVWCKFGLMARANLSDDAPMAVTHVTGANQIEWGVRVQAGDTPSTSSGLVPKGTSNLMKPVTKKAADYLVQPVWLKLGRKGLTWSSWASLDGKKWTQLGTTQNAEFGACWVGIQACAHNTDFGDKGYVRGVFDNLSFKPTKLVQLGDQGVPPTAGPVPKNWATV